MLQPRFSIRWMFGFTAVCAVVLLVVVQAGEAGEALAIGGLVALGFAGLTLLFHAQLMLMLWDIPKNRAVLTCFECGVILNGIASILLRDNIPVLLGCYGISAALFAVSAFNFFQMKKTRQSRP